MVSLSKPSGVKGVKLGEWSHHHRHHWMFECLVGARQVGAAMSWQERKEVKSATLAHIHMQLMLTWLTLKDKTYLQGTLSKVIWLLDQKVHTSFL